MDLTLPCLAAGIIAALLLLVILWLAESDLMGRVGIPLGAVLTVISFLFRYAKPDTLSSFEMYLFLAGLSLIACITGTLLVMFGLIALPFEIWPSIRRFILHIRALRGTDNHLFFLG